MEKEHLPARAGADPFPDEALMLEVRDGLTGRMAILFERHHRPLFHFFYRLTSSREVSEDLVQDVFFRMLKYRETFEPKASFTAWMYQVARNVFADQARKRRPETAWPEDGVEPPSREAPADEQVKQRQETVLLRKALAALPVEKREVLVLSRYQNLKYSEIGRILGCDENTVKVRVFRAVRALGQVFTELAGERT